MCKNNNESHTTTESLEEEEQLSRSQEMTMTIEEFSMSSRALLRRMKQKFSENMPEWTTSSKEEEDEQTKSGYLEEDDNRDDNLVVEERNALATSKKNQKKSTKDMTKNNESSYSSTMMKKAKEAIATVTEQQETELRDKQEKIIWRDFTFLSIALVLGCIMSFVEMHSADVEIRGGTVDDVAKGGIMDAGFILTRPLHDYLEENRWVNDLLAAINSIIGVFGPFLYMAYQTAWVGDYDVVFRYLVISAIRSACGWVTFLPPDPSYLVSYYDFPDIAQCVINDCGDPRNAKVQPFVTFFSGHVATLVINANHMYLNGYRNLGIFFHIFDIFQVIRLLATRGHYSIDIVIGWYMAVHVSNPAGRLGRHFSRGDKSLSELMVPVSKQAAFEQMTGVTMIRDERRASASHKPSEDYPKDKMEQLWEENNSSNKLPNGVAKMMADSFFEHREAETKKTK